MLHNDKEGFLKILERTSAQTGFPLRLLEKDYYITIILSQINNKLSNDLIFKGATCLSKIYYSYYRLSEDLDFTLKLHIKKPTRTIRRKAIQPIKGSIKSFVKNFNMDIEDIEKTGHNISTQYIFYLDYHSVILDKKESIKLEIGLRFNPILPTVIQKVTHRFLHPFTKEPLFDPGTVDCLCLKELVAEKMRAAITRDVIAARDFYDLGYLLREKFDFKDKEFLMLFKRKLEEDNFSPDLRKYRFNLGRSEKEIEDMKLRIKDELFSVLNIQEREFFDIQKLLNTLNKILKNIK